MLQELSDTEHLSRGKCASWWQRLFAIESPGPKPWQLLDDKPSDSDDKTQQQQLNHQSNLIHDMSERVQRMAVWVRQRSAGARARARARACLRMYACVCVCVRVRVRPRAHTCVRVNVRARTRCRKRNLVFFGPEPEPLG